MTAFENAYRIATGLMLNAMANPTHAGFASAYQWAEAARLNAYTTWVDRGEPRAVDGDEWDTADALMDAIHAAARHQGYEVRPSVLADNDNPPF